jgi:hypothetical protein
MIKTLYRSKPDPHVLSLVLSRAKGGAVSPRLANRYSRFALSHRSCGDGFCQSPKRYNVLKDHRWPTQARFWLEWGISSARQSEVRYLTPLLR